MTTLKQRRELDRMTREEFRQAVREKADRADTLVAWASLIGLAILLVVQLMEKAG